MMRDSQSKFTIFYLKNVFCFKILDQFPRSLWPFRHFVARKNWDVEHGPVQSCGSSLRARTGMSNFRMNPSRNSYFRKSFKQLPKVLLTWSNVHFWHTQSALNSVSAGTNVWLGVLFPKNKAVQVCYIINEMCNNIWGGVNSKKVLLLFLTL